MLSFPLKHLSANINLNIKNVKKENTMSMVVDKNNSTINNQTSNRPTPTEENIYFIAKFERSEEGEDKVKSLVVAFFDKKKYGLETYKKLLEREMLACVQFLDDNKDKVRTVYLEQRWLDALTTNQISIVRDGKYLLKDKNFRIKLVN
jgi:hypothetical protein